MDTAIATVEEKRVCIKCGGDPQLLSAFSHSVKPNGRMRIRRECKKCQAEYFHWRKTHPSPRKPKMSEEERIKRKRLWTRRQTLKRWYNMALSDYEAMFEAQGGVCALCGEPETAQNEYGTRHLVVDHDHITGRVRSLLCYACNAYLGRLENDALLVPAMNYINHHRNPVVPCVGKVHYYTGH